MGDHIRKRRLDLGLLQQAVAAKIGVVEASVWNWENDWSPPARRYHKAIANFLGYVPSFWDAGVVKPVLAQIDAAR